MSVLEQSPLLHFCELLAGEVLLVGDEGLEVRHKQLSPFPCQDDGDRAEDAHDYISVGHLRADEDIL